MGFGIQHQDNYQESKALKPHEVARYYETLNQLSGGSLGNFAKQGTVGYTNGPTGQPGATRQQYATDARRQAIDDLRANPGLTSAQQVRGQQMVNDKYSQTLDNIAKESDFDLAKLNIDRAKLRQSDIQTLVEAFFSGKGQNSWGYGHGAGFQMSGLG